MNRPQVSTSGGAIGLFASFTKLFLLFGDYTIVEFVDAIKVMPIKELATALMGIAISITAMYYNEDKEKVITDENFRKSN